MLGSRVLLKHWRLTAIAVFSLSIAMALAVLSLSVANTALLLPPAAFEPDRLVMIGSRSPEKDIGQISYPDYEYYRANNRVFTDIAAAPNTVSFLIDTNFGTGEIRAMARPVSSNYLDVMGIRPYLGRFFSPGDDHSHPNSVVMTYSCWKRLGADSNIVGRRFGANTIIGVTPRDFTGSLFGLNGDLLTLLTESGDNSWLTKREARSLFLIARLKPGVSKREAQSAMTGLSGQLAAAYPKEDKDRSAVVTRATLLPPDALPTAELASGILIALVLLVMLIACANVSNMLLARAVGRRHEAAVKLALGAARGRLIWEFLRETAVLCAVSAALGYGIATWAVARFSELSIEFPTLGSYSFGLNLRLDFMVFALTFALMLLAILATGLAPALYASSPGIAQILSGEMATAGTAKAAWRNTLVILQVAVCTLVLVGLGLCLRNLYNLRHVDMGFRERNLVSIPAYLQSEAQSEARGKQLYANFRRAIGMLPGVTAVSLASDLPLQGGREIPLQIPDGPAKVPVMHSVVDAEYFQVLGMPILKGRGFNSSDREKSPETAVINRKLAETFWPGQDPLGRTILAGEPSRKVTVVGVVADGKYQDVDEPTRPFLYLALSQHYLVTTHVIARTSSDPRLLLEPFYKTMQAEGVKAPIRAATFESWFNLSLLTQRIAAAIVSALSALGLLLATLGLAGAVSYSVSERRRELGIRVALGAGSRHLISMVLRQVLRIVGVGIVLGLSLGVAASSLLRSQFYEVGAVEWTVLIPVTALMLAVSLGVAYFSAKPWIAANPMDAVRHY